MRGCTRASSIHQVQILPRQKGCQVTDFKLREQVTDDQPRICCTLITHLAFHPAHSQGSPLSERVGQRQRRIQVSSRCRLYRRVAAGLPLFPTRPQQQRSLASCFVKRRINVVMAKTLAPTSVQDRRAGHVALRMVGQYFVACLQHFDSGEMAHGVLSSPKTRTSPCISQNAGSLGLTAPLGRAGLTVLHKAECHRLPQNTNSTFSGLPESAAGWHLRAWPVQRGTMTCFARGRECCCLTQPPPLASPC